ncbi:MAG TPA: hydroxyisourate hydrolase [Actinomycetes bacterium]|jgi:5-hydroxyisourate hydrolase|nr:hydroxyisourate hydrolase [Actinomycetes bacterium]
MSVTTHVLDLRAGCPAAGVWVVLETRDGDGGWWRVGGGATGADGRLSGLLPPDRHLEPGAHRLVFDTGAWFAEQGVDAFYPEVSVVFEVTDPTQHFHVPLLLSPFGYSTYRGS